MPKKKKEEEFVEEDQVETFDDEEPVEEQPEEETSEEETTDEETTEESPSEGRKDSYGRTLYKAKCADCGKETEVPFKPDPNRPVYCRDCFRNHRPSRPKRF